jgi:choline transport protein
MAEYNSHEIGPLGGDMDKQTALESRAHAPRFDVEDESEEYHESLRDYTRADRADMLRMGKVQELKRNYRPLSALAFTVILQGTWEVLLT